QNASRGGSCPIFPSHSKHPNASEVRSSMDRRFRTLALTFSAALALAACRTAQPEAPPPPPPTPTPSTPPETPRPPEPTEDPAVVAARNRATLMEMIHFDFDRADIRADARQVL